MTGQTQLSKAGKLGTSKKTQLLSEAQTQITSTSLETGEIVRNTHIHSYTCTHVHYTIHTHTYIHTHTHTVYTMYVYMYVML